MRFHGIARATAAAALALAACSQSRPGPTGAAAAVTVSRGGPAGGTVSVSPEGCTRCHGDMARAGADADPLAVAAPPRTPSGLDTDPAIGAHRKHLEGGAFWRPVECASCHVLPAAAESHVRQEQGKVTFSLMARASWGAGAAPSPTWDGAGCASTYCHGSFPNGAGSNPISWNAAPGSAGCGSCHGLPPAGSHPGVSPTTSCASCHEGYDGMPGGPIVLSGAALQNHLNGRLDASGGHPAGWKEPGQHGLAAIDSSRGGLAACQACHVAFGAAGGAQSSCNGCHASPATYGPYTSGTYPDHPSWQTECTFCHGGRGGDTQGAPPRTTRVVSSDATTPQTTSDPAIGAHRQHLAGTSLRASPIACAECHAVPADLSHAGGAGTGGARALLTWGTLARGASSGAPVSPAYAGSTTAAGGATAGSCSATWCHGNIPNGAGQNPISWTASSPAAACGTCHGLPPAGTHPSLAAGTACSGCHPGYTGTAGGTSWAVNTALHLNGVVDAAGNHPAGWKEPAQHGLSAIDVSLGGLSACTACHTGFGPAGGAQSSCNGCHASPATYGPYTSGTYPNHANWQTECTFCHGGRGGDTQGAPPRNTHVVSSDAATPQPTTDVTIGAHASHVQAAHAVAQRLACGACHPGPYTNVTTDVGHVDAATADVSFAAVGSTANPGTYARPTCASNYCHGNFTGGSSASLAWTGTFGAAFTLSCTSCHGSPPGPVSATVHHPQSPACGDCHPGYGSTTVAAATHVDGTVQKPSGCTACHGELNPAVAAQPVASGSLSAAPGYGATPTSKDSHGNTATASRGVGVHNLHLAGTRSRPVACGECHTVPAANDVAHANGTAQVTFAATLADKSGGAAYSTAALTCSATYCHGNFAGGAGPASTTPAWTAAGTLACTACHGNPPPASSGHPQNTSCASCHGPGYSTTTVNAATHVDGTVNLVAAESCTSCHGTPGRASVAGADANQAAAPPNDTLGNSAATAAGVGAHLAHVNQSRAVPLSKPFSCATCHPVPTSNLHGNGTSQVTFTGIAVTGSIANASYASPSCTATYCHGNFIGGSGTAAPAWNASGAQLGCTACHGAPPGPVSATVHHPQSPACADCHAGYSATAVAVATHVDGTVQKPSGCTACHGELNPAVAAQPVASGSAYAAPGYGATPTSKDSHGNTATASRGVGVHNLHLAGTRSRPVACGECHTVPAANDVAHANGTAQVTFAATLADKSGGATYSTAALTCASTYCHGNFTGGVGAAATPAWTAAGTLACTACHGAPPGPVSATVHHPQNPNCQACHPGYTASTVAAATHVDGTVQKPTGCTACHGDLTATGVASTDVRAAPAANANAVDTRGNAATATAQRGIGAHQKHLTGTAWRSTPIACSECHAVPAAGDETHVSGTPVVTFGALARTAWAGQPAIAPVWNGAGGATTLTCASTYCHGNFKNGANATPTWATPSAVACDSCHAVSAVDGPGGTHPTLTAGQNCGTCHGGSYTNTSVDPVLHLNGQLDGGGESSGGSACGGCHSATFSAMNGGTPKAFKHALGAVAGTNDSPSVGTADWTLAANLQGAVAPSGRSCANMCHADHVHTNVGGGATHEYNVYLDAGTAATRGATASATTRDSTDFDSAATSGGLCVSCHTRPIDATAGRITVTKASFAGTGHDYVQNTVGATTYTWSFAMHDGGVFQRNCTKCHAGGAGEDQASVSGTALGAVHYSDNDSLLMGSSVPAGGTASVSTFVCYKCHGTATAGTTFPMNRSGVDVYLEAQKAQGHGGAATAAIANLNNDSHHSTLAEASAAFGGTLYSGAGRHVSCLDCHDPHESGKTSRNYAAAGAATRNQIPAGSPLTGASGIQYGTAGGAGKSYPALPASGSWPATAAANYGNATVRATYEYEICFKCHTGFAFGSTPPAATATPSALAETDLGLEFSPTLRSGHPVVSPLNSYTGNTAPKALVAAQVAAPFNTAMGTQTMTCTDCHFGDAASPAAQGPHGSAVKFMLRGPNQTWPGTFTLATSGASAYNAGAGTSAGLFCLNCHPMRTGTTWANNVHSRSNHSSRTCVTCHILVPHGGKVSRLIAAKGTGTSTLPARYDGGSAVTQFRKAASPTGYDTPNCNTSCGGHGTVTTPETW